MVNRSRIALKILPYVAGVIFIGMWIAAMDISSQITMMTDTGFTLYHDPIDVEVFWLQSKACMILPPDGSLANCVYIGSIRTVTVLTVLLVIVLLGYAIVRKRENPRNVTPAPARNPR